MRKLLQMHRKRPRLVVGINKVDTLVPNAWDERLNMPTSDAQIEIDRRCGDAIRHLTRTRIPIDNIEYYAAIKHFRLLLVLSKLVRSAYAGFKLDNVSPADPFELADSDVRDFALEQRKRHLRSTPSGDSARHKIFDELRKLLPANEFSLVLKTFQKEQATPPRIAIIGKAGVGKTTTVNKLFNATFKTSHVGIGTTDAQHKVFSLAAGGELEIIDLPGYGRTLAEDEKYDAIYSKIIPSCDVVLLVLQANTRDFADDQEMVLKIVEWLETSAVPLREER